MKGDKEGKNGGMVKEVEKKMTEKRNRRRNEKGVPLKFRTKFMPVKLHVNLDKQ